MIDGFKATTIIPDIDTWKKSTGIELSSAYNVDSGEQIRSRKRVYDNGKVSYPYWAKYENYLINVIETRFEDKSTWRLNIRGSFYVASAKGLDYSWNDLQLKLSDFETGLGVSLNQCRLTSIEYFVDMPWHEPAINLFSNSFIMYRNLGTCPFKPNKRNQIDWDFRKTPILGFECDATKHILKGYDKTLQLKQLNRPVRNLETEVLRLEDHVSKMQYIESTGIKTLEDLTKPELVSLLPNKLAKVWRETILFDTRIISQATESDKSKLMVYSAPTYWIDPGMTEKAIRYNKSKLADLQNKYSDGAHGKILNAIINNNFCYANALRS